MPSQAIAIIHREEIISQLAQGKRLSDIAPSLQVTPNAISKALKDDSTYRDAIEAGFHYRLDTAEKAIEDACEQVDVARARARFQSVAWRAEREFPERWGQQTKLTLDISDFGEELRRARDARAARERREEKVIESTAEEIPAARSVVGNSG